MTDEDWEIVVQVFRAVRSLRGDKGRDDRTFLEALHYFCVHNITWRALPATFGKWNSIWKRFWRLVQGRLRVSARLRIVREWCQSVGMRSGRPFGSPQGCRFWPL